MTPASGHYPIETMRDRLRDHSRRIMRLERMPAAPTIVVDPAVAAVRTAAEVFDAPGAVYVVETSTYHYQGSTLTPAEWQAMQQP